VSGAYPMTPSPAQIRVGIPKSGGELVAHAARRGYSVLFSANAFVRDAPTAAEVRAWRDAPVPRRIARDPERLQAWRAAKPPREFKGWRRSFGHLEGLDAALDSAGFVAWSRYGDFRWTVDRYVELAGRFPWAWWAQMDACVEAKVAGNRKEVRGRQAETLRLQGECEAVAAREGVAPPMPVLQGRDAGDYVWHARRALTGREAIVGVGSMCTRALHRTEAGPDGPGEDGLLDVVAALDAELAPGTRLHLFGVKTAGLRHLGYHPRLASIDSMAWDFRARHTRPGGVSRMADRCARMDAWVANVTAAREAARDRRLPPRPTPPADSIHDDSRWFELVEGGDMTFRDELGMAAPRSSWDRPNPMHYDACDVPIDPRPTELDGQMSIFTYSGTP
jgi:hypothetical protein